ncbi:MAG: heavy-metal-associated domain-containing protein [Clostridia bacterium]
MSVEKALKALNGVESAEVNLEKKQAQITGTALDTAAIAAAISNAGFECKGIQ